MRYDVGRFRRPMRRSTEGQLMSLISLGDGSTLTLDFTTGVLDSRLTFTRASNATFINSSGLVQWAASNHAPRTNWNFTSPTGSGWNAATTSGTGTFQWVGDGTVIASSGSSGQAFTSITTSTGIAEGLRYVMSVTAQSVTGSPTIQSIFDMTNASGNTYFKNGATATAGTTVASGDRISVSAVATATTMNLRMGCGAWFANRTNESVTLTQFHWHPGSSPVPYYENTATSPRYDSARFDYDPTTLAPRGLLIEGTATNLITYSDCSTTGWAGLNATGTNNNATAPDNNTAATLWTGGSGGNNRAYSATFSITNGTSYTLSVYVKKPSTNAARYAKIDMRSSIEGDVGWPANGVLDLDTGIASGTGFTATPMPNGWYRIAYTGTVNTTTNARAFLRITDATGSISITSTNALLWWGAQVEAGSGASSYIPTGASTVQRLADECSMTGTNFSSWFTNNSEGSFLVRYSMNNPSAFLGAGIDRYAYEISNSSGTSRVFCNASYRVTVAGDAGRFPRVFDLGTIDLAPSLVATAAQNTAFAWGYKSNDNHLAAVGVTANDTSGSLQTGVDRLHLGASRTFGSATYLQGCISLLKYWPTRLPNAQLQAITT
jgi:hypothetical protein